MKTRVFQKFTYAKNDQLKSILDSSDGNEEMIKKLVEEKNSLLDELDDVKREARGTKEELDERNDENANLKEEIQKLESEKEELEAKIEELSRAQPGEPIIVAGVSSDISLAASGAESEHDSAESEVAIVLQYFLYLIV